MADKTGFAKLVREHLGGLLDTQFFLGIAVTQNFTHFSQKSFSFKENDLRLISNVPHQGGRCCWSSEKKKIVLNFNTAIGGMLIRLSLIFGLTAPAQVLHLPLTSAISLVLPTVPS